MKKTFFIFSLLLASGLCFANNSEPIEKTKESIKKEKTILKTDKSTFFNDNSQKKILIKRKAQQESDYTNFVMCIIISQIDPTIAPSCYLLLTT